VVLRCALIVDAAQSIQANDFKFISSFRKRLGIIPVLKVDLPSATLKR
jgi:translation elongation factor EF-4